LRSFLAYLFQKGRTRINLASAVPSVAGWRLSELPRYLEGAQVEQILRNCDRRCKIGKRDYAMLLLFARLGLRVGEVARLALTDIDWRAGELRVHGKGGRVDRLPLPTDVGQAIVDYLRKGRPRCSARLVFIQGQVPHVGFADSPASLCGIVRRALARARIQGRHGGAHVLRHSLATRMLANGGSLAEIGRVLRHQHIQTTEIYAKVDLSALRAMTHPWPGGAQ
jgi:integrase